MRALLVGTDDGLHTLDVGGEAILRGSPVTAIAGEGATAWALANGRQLWRRASGAWSHLGSIVGDEARCLLPAHDRLYLGTAHARLLCLGASGLEHVKSFDSVDGRRDWYTPWGGPPDTRSLAVDAGGTIYANVHVGGIVRSRDGGRSWQPTAIDIDADVHQVVAHGSSGVLFAATACGLASSADGGDTWTTAADGLHATYSRAVAVADGVVLVSVSEGPDGERSAVYRRPVGGGVPFTRCTAGLPGWFPDNVDTACLAADGPVAVIGATDGTIHLSADAGRTWAPVSVGLPPVRCLSLA